MKRDNMSRGAVHIYLSVFKTVVVGSNPADEGSELGHGRGFPLALESNPSGDLVAERVGRCGHESVSQTR